jgi:alginate O-acetyltransferase complex protein AlgI
MNMFSWTILFSVLILYVLARHVLKPSSRNALMTAGAVLFLSLQTAPHFMMRLGYIGLTFIILMTGWLFGKRVSKSRTRLSLATGSLFLIAPLFLFKLLAVVLPPQLIETVITAKGGTLDLGSLAPMGISYFTFRAIAYLIELRSGSIKPVGWWPYLNYVAFWPTVMAGPIERPGPFFEQALIPARATDEDVRIGLARIGAGLFKKMIVATFFYQVALPYTLLPGSADVAAALSDWKAWHLWACVHAYYFYLYLDFAGYSDVAIGLSRLFGFRIMENFRWPMLSTNVADFWRRWHISLTGWITDYVYIPLGGNRRGLRRAAFNSMVAMVLCGFWHGLSPHFAIWGAWHAVFLIAYRQYRIKFKDKAPKTRWWTAISWFATFQIINLGWIWFIFGARQALTIFSKLFGLG